MLDIRWKAYGAAAAVFALDRLTKWIIEARVPVLSAHNVIPGFFDIVHSENRGVAFGFLDGVDSSWRTAALILLSVVAVGVMAAFLWKSYAKLDRFSLFGFALIMGGAAGNLFDRMVAGRVTDFLAFYIGSYQWPAFNVADSAITVGAGLVLLELLRPKRQAANVP